MQKVSVQPPMYSMGEIPSPDTVMWNTTSTIQLFLMFLRISWIITCLYSVYFSLYFILMLWSICLRLNYLPWKLKSSISHISHRPFLKLSTTAKSNNIGRHLCMCEITMQPNLMSRRLYKGWQTISFQMQQFTSCPLPTPFQRALVIISFVLCPHTKFNTEHVFFHSYHLHSYL